MTMTGLCNKERLREILLFGVVGTTAMGIHYGLYYLLLAYLPVNAAFSVGYLVSFLCNFMMSSYLTFKVRPSLTRFLRFAASHATNYLLQMVLLNFFVHVMSLGERLAPIPVYAISIPVSYLLVRLAMRGRKDKAPAAGKSWGVRARILVGLGVSAVLSSLVGLFVGEIRWVPTPSMENTIMARSIVWMDKTRYGSRLPRRFIEIPVLKYGFYLIPQLYPYDKRLYWGYHRLKGTGRPERGDIIAFDNPQDAHKLMCKRLIGMPGDTLELRHGQVYINGQKLRLPPTVQPTIEADTIFGVGFPMDSGWTTHNYGPLVIPSDEDNPCYFVLGDNRRHSCDSRVWGLIRFRDIAGRVLTPTIMSFRDTPRHRH